MLSVIPVYAENTDYDNADIAKIMQDIVLWKKSSEKIKVDKLFATDFVSNAGNSSADWYAIAMGRTGFDDDYFSYLAVLKNNVQSKYKTDEKLDNQKATEWHRISLAVLAVGGDPTNMGEDGSGNIINLIKDGTYDRGKTASLDAQGINGYIWGLITLDSMRYVVSDNAADTREDIIIAILKNQMENGSFTLDGDNPDTDITAMAIQALSPYYNDEKEYEYKCGYDSKIYTEKVRMVIDRAVDWLSSVQNDEGDFSAWGQNNAESTAQVMTALCCLGIDPDNDTRFIKNGYSVVDGLMKYRTNDGGFAHSYSYDEENPSAQAGKSNSMASEQTLCALCALYRYRNSFRSLYDFRQEMDENTKQQISSLNDNLKTIPTDADTAKNLFEKYLEIPITERCYVYNYSNLASAMERLGIENTSPFLEDYMDENINGNGTVTDILNNRNLSSGLKFNSSDLEEYNSLPKTLTSENYTTVLRLYEKLMQSENFSEYADISDDLSKKMNEVNAIRSEIDSINGEIAGKLYPFDAITKDDKDVVYELVKRTEKLSEYDRNQILGYEDLLKAKAQIDSSDRAIWITAIVVILVVICLSALVLRVRKKRRIKRMNEMTEENEDW